MNTMIMNTSAKIYRLNCLMATVSTDQPIQDHPYTTQMDGGMPKKCKADGQIESQSSPSNDEHSSMDDDKLDPAFPQIDKALESDKMDEDLIIIPEELKKNAKLYEAAKCVVGDYRQIVDKSNLHDFFSLLRDFIKEKKKSDSLTQGSVTVHSVVAGKTFDAHKTLLQQVKNCEGIILKDTNDWQECDIIIIFCPITTRPGSDVQEAVSKVQGNKPVILVLMHHTRKPEYATEETSWIEASPDIQLVVQVLFHQTKPGLLECEKNERAVQQIQEELMKHRRSLEGGQGDSCLG